MSQGGSGLQTTVFEVFKIALLGIVVGLLLIGASFALFRQAICASSLPYRTTGLLRGGFAENG